MLLTGQSTWLDAQGVFIYIGRVPPQDIVRFDIELDESRDSLSLMNTCEQIFLVFMLLVIYEANKFVKLHRQFLME